MTQLTDRRVLIAGAGFSGRAIGARLAVGGATVFGTSRSAEKANSLANAGIEPLIFDGATADRTFLDALAEATDLIISIAPPREESEEPDALADPLLTALRDHAFAQIAPKLGWIGYLSTVGVYGNHDGAWVDEETPAKPVSARSRQRVRAEAEWITLAETHDIPLAIFRLSGIYGPGRNALKTARDGKARRLVKPGQVFNRIHVADIAQAVSLAARKRAGGAFNITDDEPAPPQDVVAYAHELLDLEPPPEQDFATAELSPMARSFYGENKRVSNAKSKAELGMTYVMPTYRVALATMVETGEW